MLWKQFVSWVAAVSLCLCALAVAGCTIDFRPLGERPDPSTTGSTGSDPIDLGPVEQPATCNGTCVLMAPATYTGPSLFSIDWPGHVTPCPFASPFHGIQGPVQSAPVPLFARECLITPDPACALEGQTCVPSHDEGFRVCIHHDDGGGDWSCDEGDLPGAYPFTSRMIDDANGQPVTLCCTAPVQKG